MIYTRGGFTLSHAASIRESNSLKGKHNEREDGMAHSSYPHNEAFESELSRAPYDVRGSSAFFSLFLRLSPHEDEI